MDSYIKKEAFLEHMKKTSRYFAVKFDIEEFPTEDVVPVGRGKWEKFHLGAYDFATRLRCSNCSHVVYEEGYNFCPNCGKYMREEG